MTRPLTRDYGRFVAGLRFADLPPTAVAVARTGFIDCIGVMIAGRGEAAPRLLLEVLAPPGGEATVCFGPRRAPAPEAAWINGTAAHALDLDDVGLRAHPSAVMVPAILAEAEVLGASGERVLAAYVAGFEVWADLVRRDARQHSLKGWHPTGIFGPIAAAAACASLRGLDADVVSQAIALGASQSAGLMSNFGTMTKPYHAGRAAHAGVMSARLAGVGFTAAADALEHPRGFLAAVSPGGEIDVDTPVQAGQPWGIVRDGIAVKKYPSCYATHRAVDGMLALAARHGLQAGDVATITVTVSARNALILRHHRPRSGLEGKFSIEFALAGALVAGRLGLAEHTDAFVRQTAVQRLIERVRIETDPREDPLTGHAPFDRVVVVTTDGSTLDSGPITAARGAYALPLSPIELAEKFVDCATIGGEGARAPSLLAALLTLETSKDCAWISLP